MLSSGGYQNTLFDINFIIMNISCLSFARKKNKNSQNGTYNHHNKKFEQLLGTNPTHPTLAVDGFKEN